MDAQPSIGVVGATVRWTTVTLALLAEPGMTSGVRAFASPTLGGLPPGLR